jgi:iron complex transport system substrate-binding protein
VRDDAGRAVSLEPAPRRIISLLPSATELIVALGGGDRLIARTAYDAQPALAHLPSFGRAIAASVESLVALEPDLVVLPPDYLTSDLARRLASFGVRVYEADAQRLDALFATVGRLAALLGARARGDSLASALRDGLRDVRAAHTREPPVDVVYAVWHSPPTVAGADTYVDDIIAAAGGRNVFADVSGWPEVSPEALLARDPAFVIVAGSTQHPLRPELLRDAPGWRGLRAVREGRVVAVDPDLFNRPGARVVEAARVLAAALHGERDP